VAGKAVHSLFFLFSTALVLAQWTVFVVVWNWETLKSGRDVFQLAPTDCNHHRVIQATLTILTIDVHGHADVGRLRDF
jgi:hypothetical protein